MVKRSITSLPKAIPPRMNIYLYHIALQGWALMLLGDKIPDRGGRGFTYTREG
jgi:hypothetical protein